jgi:hypothetical protein
MKAASTLLLLLSFTSLIAQPIALPSYQQGHYENDTVYTYYGSLPSSGIGNISFNGVLLSTGFVTGVDFKVVVDSTDPGASPIHAAFRDSLGTFVPVYQGDTLAVPAAFQLYAGAIGFRVIIEGTPQMANETYLCNLEYTFTTGTDWGMLIMESTPDSCQVDPISGSIEINEDPKINIYPNPFKRRTTIEFENHTKEPYAFILYDLLGKEVKTIKNIGSNRIVVEKEGLPSGILIFQLRNKYGIISTGKLMTEH